MGPRRRRSGFRLSHRIQAFLRSQSTGVESGRDDKHKYNRTRNNLSLRSFEYLF